MSSPVPRNFSTHAIEYLQAQLPRFAQHPEGAYELDRYEEALHWLSTSVKFIGPEHGEFLDRIDPVADGVDWPHLPFPAICLEYEYCWSPQSRPGMNSFGIDIAQNQPDRVAVLAFYPDLTSPLGARVLTHYKVPQRGEFVVWPIMSHPPRRDNPRNWVLGDPVLVIPEQNKNWSVDFRGVDKAKHIIIQALPSKRDIEFRKEGNAARGRPDVSLEHIAHEITNDSAWEAIAVVELCNILDCSNVDLITEAPPPKLNAKRTSSGKPSFFEYRLLKLKIPQARDPARPSSSVERTAPRLHRRRGHIRRLSSERKIWINDMLVGDPTRGVLAKAYDTTALAQ